ncbi:TPA: hypothetical protein ACT9K7_003364, partial [Legionella pneumophila]
MDKIEQQRNTLLFVHISTHFKEIIRVARLMKQNGAYNPYIFFYVKYEGVKRDIEQCQSEGISFITYFDLNASRQSGFNLKLKLLRFFFKLLLKFLEVIRY